MFFFWLTHFYLLQFFNCAETGVSQRRRIADWMGGRISGTFLKGIWVPYLGPLGMKAKEQWHARLETSQGVLRANPGGKHILQSSLSRTVVLNLGCTLESPGKLKNTDT